MLNTLFFQCTYFRVFRIKYFYILCGILPKTFTWYIKNGRMTSNYEAFKNKILRALGKSKFGRNMKR